MLGKCFALWGRTKFKLQGLIQRKPLRSMEAEKIFWRTPELVENLISFLDPASILALAKTSTLTRKIMRRGLNWSRLIKRTCPEQSIILQQPFEGGLATAEKALEPIIEILQVLDKTESHLLQLLDIICQRFPSNHTSAGPDQVKVACPCHEVHEVSTLGFLLLEMVERSAETCRQQIDLVFVWQIIGPLLPALKSRMSRRGGLITRIVCDNFVFETQEDAEAFLALVKIGDSILFHRSVVIIITIIIMIFISINLGWLSVDQLVQEAGRLWQRR